VQNLNNSVFIDPNDLLPIIIQSVNEQQKTIESLTNATDAIAINTTGLKVDLQKFQLSFMSELDSIKKTNDDQELRIKQLEEKILLLEQKLESK
jgi:hypothetical protein